MNASIGDLFDYVLVEVARFPLLSTGVFYCPSYAIYFEDRLAIAVCAGKILPGQPI